MSLFSKIRADFARGLAENKLAELLEPYEIELRSIEFREKGWFRVKLHVPSSFGRVDDVEITGDVGFSVDQPRAVLLNLRTSYRWLTLLADKHLVGRELPLTPDQVNRLRKLWP